MTTLFGNGRDPTKITSTVLEKGSGKGAETRSTATSHQQIYCQRPAQMRRCGTDGMPSAASVKSLLELPDLYARLERISAD